MTIAPVKETATTSSSDLWIVDIAVGTSISIAGPHDSLLFQRSTPGVRGSTMSGCGGATAAPHPADNVRLKNVCAASTLDERRGIDRAMHPMCHDEPASCPRYRFLSPPHGDAPSTRCGPGTTAVVALRQVSTKAREGAEGASPGLDGNAEPRSRRGDPGEPRADDRVRDRRRRQDDVGAQARQAAVRVGAKVLGSRRRSART